ncbi:MAG: hypothetical protein ABWZ99_02475 [Ilumatobacteraceae bacterium]
MTTMLRLRQIALVAKDRDAVVDDFVAVFGLAVGYEDPHISNIGLHNALMPIGTQLLEVVAPIVEGITAERYLERRGGDGGYMVITQTDEHATRRARVDELGIRIVGQFDDHGFTNMQLHPRDTGGSFLEIDEQEGGEDPYGPWSPAGPDWQSAIRTDVVSAITAAEVQCDDPDAVSARWSEIIELAREKTDGAPTIALTNATLRFVPIADGRGEGLGGIDLATADVGWVQAAAARRGLQATADEVLVGGLRCYLR